MAKVTITLSASNVPAGGTVQGKAEVELEEKLRGRIDLNWEDSSGRVIDQISKEVRFPARRVINFKFSLRKFPTTMVNKIVLQVTDVDIELRKERAEARFTITPTPFVWDDFEAILWGEKLEGAGAHYFQVLRDLGVTAGMTYAVPPPRPRRPSDWITDHNLRFYVENVCQIGWDGKIFNQLKEIIAKYEESGDKEYLERNPCIHNPAYLAASKERIQKEVLARREFSPIAYCIGDEQSIASFTRPFDFCFGPLTLKKFREYLKGSYKTLENLNAEWETNFKTWDEVLPMTREEARARDGRSFAPWADHRAFMDSAMAELIEKFTGYFHEVEPGAYVGIEGTQKPGPYGGFDYCKLMNTSIGFIEAYDIGGAREIVRSLIKDNCALVGLAGPNPRQIKRLWNMPLHGTKAVILWWLPTYTKKDDSPTEGALAIKDVLRELTGGLGKLLLLQARQHEAIAIHYSHASVRGKWITMKTIPRASDHEIQTEIDFERLAAMRAVQDLGYQYNFISYEQVEKGGLSEYQVLLMPASIALSRKEVTEIEKFVRAGGTVIADYQPGWMDEHCKLLKEAPLDKLFGVSRDSFEMEPFETQASRYSRGGYWGEKMPDIGQQYIEIERMLGGLNMVGTGLNYPVVESSIKARKGTAKGSSKGIPAIIVNKVGKGHAVLLNFRLMYYLNHRARHTTLSQAPMTLRLLRALLELGGVKPEVSLSAPLDTELVRFKSGKAQYLAVIRNPEEFEQGGLGEVAMHPAETEITPADISLKLPEARHVYETLSGTYLGETDTPSGTLEPEKPLIFSALPYRVTEVQIRARDRLQRGRRFVADISLFTREEVEWEAHVLRIRLYDANGQEMHDASKNLVTRTGKVRYSFDTALNDLTGEWKLTVRDITTGLEAEHCFEMV